MSPLSGRALVGLGAGLAAAGLATAVGVTADRLGRARGTARQLDQDAGLASYDETPDEDLVVIADDGVPLHVEVDLPRGRPEDVPAGAPVPTVLFCHGYTLNLRCWVFQRRALKAAGYRVVLWDARGHGRSGPGTPESYDMAQLGRDLRSVIAATTPTGPLVLVGHSMGGMTMMSLAVEDPELIRRQVIGAAFIATSPGGLSAVHWGLGNAVGRAVHRVGPAAVGRLATRQGLVTSALRAGRDLEDFLVDRYSFASPVPLSIVRLLADMIFGTSLEVMSQFMPVFDTHDKREALARFNGVETLVLNGKQDLLTPPEHSEEIVRLVPGAEHVLVNDAGHIVMLEHPGLVSDQLIALAQRAMRAAEQSASTRSTARPRVRRDVTDLARRRRIAGARPRAAGDEVSRELFLASAEATQEWGRRLGSVLRAGDLVVLTGGLGAGKTTLTQGVAEGLGVRGPITSPTFVLSRVHPSLVGGPALVHADAYRLGEVRADGPDAMEQLEALDLDAWLDDSVTVVEWGAGLVEGLDTDYLELTISRLDDEARRVLLEPNGDRWSTPDAVLALDTLLLET